MQKSDAIKQKKTQTTLHHDERHYRAKYFQTSEFEFSQTNKILEIYFFSQKMFSCGTSNKAIQFTISLIKMGISTKVRHI